MPSLLSFIALAAVWHSVEVRNLYVRKLDTSLDEALDEALVKMALSDSTPDRYQTEQYFSKWNKAVDPRVTRWAWSSCGGTTDLVVVGNITVAPDPIKLPGTITVSVAAKIKQDIPDPIEAQLTIRKKLGILWITIPCIDNVGSCTYPGVCQMLEKVTCPAPVVSIGQNCRCPIKQSDGFYMQPSEFVINAGGDIPTGDYQIEAKASHNGQSITCVNISFTIEH